MTENNHAQKLYEASQKIAKWQAKSEDASTTKQAAKALRKIAKFSHELAYLQGKRYVNENKYEDNRYERLKESIDEYLGEEGPDNGSGSFFRDIRKACIELNYYHQECVDNFTTVQDYFS